MTQKPLAPAAAVKYSLIYGICYNLVQWEG